MPFSIHDHVRWLLEKKACHHAMQLVVFKSICFNAVQNVSKTHAGTCLTMVLHSGTALLSFLRSRSTRSRSRPRNANSATKFVPEVSAWLSPLSLATGGDRFLAVCMRVLHFLIKQNREESHTSFRFGFLLFPGPFPMTNSPSCPSSSSSAIAMTVRASLFVRLI